MQIKIEYDKTGNRTGFAITRGSISESVQYEYDDFYRLKKVKDSDDEEFVYAYNASGTRATLTYPNYTKIEYSEYDDINRVGGISYIRSQIPEKPVILDAVNFAYDHINNVTQKTTLAGSEAYTYDNNYRLTGVNYGKTGESLSYAYNTNGLRTSVTENGVPKTYTYNITGNEELTSVGTITYGYDAKGNVSRAGTGYYYHDDFNMLIEVLDSVNNTHVAYNYDIENRLKKRNDINAGKRSVFLYEGRDIFAEVDATQVEGLSSVYIRGVNGELLKEKRFIKDENNQAVKVKYYYYPDRIGSVYMVCDEKGLMLEKNSEDVFGLRGAGCGLSKYGLSSNMYDSATGLYYFAARWYDPKVGRFLEMDPVLSEPGMMNMYDYCGNNPGNVVDKWGESWNDMIKDFSEISEGYSRYMEQKKAKPKKVYSDGEKDVSKNDDNSSSEARTVIMTNAEVYRGTVEELQNNKIIETKIVTKLGGAILMVADLSFSCVEGALAHPDEPFGGSISGVLPVVVGSGVAALMYSQGFSFMTALLFGVAYSAITDLAVNDLYPPTNK